MKGALRGTASAKEWPFKFTKGRKFPKKGEKVTEGEGEGRGRGRGEGEGVRWGEGE